MIVKNDKFAPITADELWDSLMSINDFIELMASQPKNPYLTEQIEEIDFCPTFINKISTHV